MKQLIGSLLLGTFLFCNSLSAQENGKILIFLQHGRSITEDFKRDALPGIKAFAQQQKIDVQILDAREGAPAEVKFTPAIFFQNESGRSMYEGRYLDVKKIEIFVNNPTGNIRSENRAASGYAPVWNIGRSKLSAPLKVHPLTGNVPGNFDQEEFAKQAYTSIIAGMDYFKTGNGNISDEGLRTFYLEFYPEKTKDGLLLVSMKVFSAFDPGKAVFETNIPSGGEWNNPDFVWRKAGNRLEKAMMAQITSWDHGDGFDTLDRETPVKTWEALGLWAPPVSNVSR